MIFGSDNGLTRPGTIATRPVTFPRQWTGTGPPPPSTNDQASADANCASGGQNPGSEIGYPFIGFTLPLSLQRFFGREPAKLLGNEICDFTSTGIPPFVKADSQSQDNRSTLSLTQGAQQVGVAISDRGSPLSVITFEVSRFSGRASERITVGHGVLRSFCVGLRPHSWLGSRQMIARIR